MPLSTTTIIQRMPTAWRCLLPALCAAIFGATIANAQPAVIAGHYYYQKMYGGPACEQTGYHPVDKTSDGGYVMVGTTTSFNGGIYVVKVSETGAVLWSKTYNIANLLLHGENIRQTKDGGYIITGSCNAKPYLLKTDSKGIIQWQFAYQSNHNALCMAVQQTSDGGYIVVGTDGYNENIYVLKVSSTGTMQWSNLYTVGLFDQGWSVQQAADGGYVVAGFTRCCQGHLESQIILLKLGSNGAVQWVNRYANDLYSALGCTVEKTADGGYIVMGGDASSTPARGSIHLVKTDAGGTLQWARTYSIGTGTAYSPGFDVKQLSSGGYVVVGAYGAKAYLLKTAANGSVVWSKLYTNNPSACAYGVTVVADGYAMCATARPGTSVGLTGYEDYCLIKTDTNGNVACNVATVATTSPSVSGTTAMPCTTVAVGPRISASLVAASPATQTQVACYSVEYPKAMDIGINDRKTVGFIPVHLPGNGEPTLEPGHIWKSQSIWVRNMQDNVVGSRAVGSFYEHEAEHQNPLFNGSPNYVYVMVDNLGSATSSEATLKVYWSKSAANTGWQAHWVNDVNPLDGHLYGDLVGSVTIPEIPPGENYVAELPWAPPNPTQYGETQSTYSFLARIESAEDPMSFAETSNTEQNTRNNNNIAWHAEVNVSAAEMQAGDPGHVKHMIVRNMTAAPLTVGLALSVPAEEQGINPIISQGSVRVDLGGLYALWHAGGSIGAGVVDNGDGSVTVTSEDATIGGMTLQAGEEHAVHISFTYAGAGVYEDDPYTYDLVQQGGDDGGVGFELHFPVAPDNGGGGEGGGGDVTKPVAPGVSPGEQGAGGYRLTAQPNPSHGTVVISYHLPTSGAVQVGIYDVRGVLVRELVGQADESAGDHAVAWDGLDGRGRAAGSGVYLYRLETESGAISRRLQLVR